jgi:hypothetical protein
MQQERRREQLTPQENIMTMTDDQKPINAVEANSTVGVSCAPRTGSPIPPIESAILNIGTAVNDCEWAKSKWIDGEWNDCTMWISNAIAQLESARSKIYAHQESENEKAQQPRERQ